LLSTNATCAATAGRRTLQTLDPYVPHERFAAGHVCLRTMTILRGGGGRGSSDGVVKNTTKNNTKKATTNEDEEGEAPGVAPAGMVADAMG
jgi:hypothetical protein